MSSKDRFMLAVGFALITYFVFTVKKPKENFSSIQLGGNSMKNIYGDTLKSCGNIDMGHGSWDTEHRCSETTGALHQICFRKLGEKANDFSVNTGQSDWSNDRGNNNHCVCLGAWSLYIAKKNRGEIEDNFSNQIKCDAIPEDAFNRNNYGRIYGWDKWNRLEKDYPTQGKDGVEELFKICYDQAETDNQKSYLKEKYCRFSDKIPLLKNSTLYENFC